MFKTSPTTGKRYAKNAFDRQALHVLLLITTPGVPIETIDTWTSEQRLEAGDWALRTHLRAADNLNRVPPQPAFVAAAIQEPVDAA